MSLSLPLQAAKDILTSSTSYTFGAVTHPLSEWYSTGADNACIAAMNDLTLGAGLNKVVARKTIDGNDLVDAIGASDEFSSMQPATLAQLTFLMNRSGFSVTLNSVKAVDKALAPFDTAKAAFNLLKTRPGTAWEDITKNDGAAFTQTEMSAIRAG